MIEQPPSACRRLFIAVISDLLSFTSRSILYTQEQRLFTCTYSITTSYVYTSRSAHKFVQTPSGCPKAVQEAATSGFHSQPVVHRLWNIIFNIHHDDDGTIPRGRSVAAVEQIKCQRWKNSGGRIKRPPGMYVSSEFCWISTAWASSAGE